MSRFVSFFVLAMLVTVPAAAQDAPGEPRFVGSVGVSPGIDLRADYGSELRAAFVPELVGSLYLPLAPRLFLRPTVRLGVEGITQPEMTRDLAIHEYGGYAAVEAGIVLDEVVMPSLSVGLGPSVRVIDFVGSGLVEQSGSIDRTEASLLLYAQLGLGIPIEHGWVVLEPYVRAFHVVGDERAWLRLGVDLTVGIP